MKLHVKKLSVNPAVSLNSFLLGGKTILIRACVSLCTVLALQQRKCEKRGSHRGVLLAASNWSAWC